MVSCALKPWLGLGKGIELEGKRIARSVMSRLLFMWHRRRDCGVSRRSRRCGHYPLRGLVDKVKVVGHVVRRVDARDPAFRKCGVAAG